MSNEDPFPAPEPDDLRPSEQPDLPPSSGPSDASPGSPEAGADPMADAASFAGSLGPSSVAHVKRPEVAARVAALIRQGRSPRDAVLCMVHAGIEDDPDGLGNEFADFLFPLVERRGGSARTLRRKTPLRRIMETSDLANSVFLRLWPEITSFEFQTLDQFIALFVQRMEYRAGDHARRAMAEKRSEDRRLPAQPDELGQQELSRVAGQTAASPLEQMERRELEELLELVRAQLSERERELIAYRQLGYSMREIAELMGFPSPDAARSAYGRARKHARSELRRLLPPDGRDE